MKRLLAYARKFETSRPVFVLSKERSYIDVNVNSPMYMYRPQPETDDVLEELVCSNFQEQFVVSRGQFEINVQRIVEESMSDVRASMANFLEKNLEMKNPKQSKLYKWFYYSGNMPNSDNFNDSLCLLYKYLRTFSSSDMRGVGIEHINNAIAIMEAIMEKYK